MLLFYKVSVVEGEDDGGDDDLGPEVADLGSADDGGEGKSLFKLTQQEGAVISSAESEAICKGCLLDSKSSF